MKLIAISDKQVEKHMRSMRTTYSRYVRLPSGSAASHASARMRRLNYLIGFLRPHMRVHEGSSNVNPISIDDTDDKDDKDDVSI